MSDTSASSPAPEPQPSPGAGSQQAPGPSSQAPAPGTEHSPPPVAAPGEATRTNARWLLAGILFVAGCGHFLSADTFTAQVPTWMPWPAAVIAVSGVVELALAVALVAAKKHQRPLVGWVVAAFFVVIFPGNISQFLTHTDAFGLDSDAARLARLFFQPVLVAWALWCTGAWSQWRQRRRATVGQAAS